MLIIKAHHPFTWSWSHFQKIALPHSSNSQSASYKSLITRDKAHPATGFPGMEESSILFSKAGLFTNIKNFFTGELTALVTGTCQSHYLMLVDCTVTTYNGPKSPFIGLSLKGEAVQIGSYL